MHKVLYTKLEKTSNILSSPSSIIDDLETTEKHYHDKRNHL